MVETKDYVLDSASYLKIYRSESLKTLKKMLLYFMFLVLFVIGISIYGYIKLGNLEIFKSWVPLLLIFSIFFVYVYWICPIVIYKNKDNKHSFTNRKFWFFDEKLEYETEEGYKCTIPYSVIVKNNVGKNYFALWESSLTAHMIPFSAFKSDGDIEFVKESIGEKHA